MEKKKSNATARKKTKSGGTTPANPVGYTTESLGMAILDRLRAMSKKEFVKSLAGAGIFNKKGRLKKKYRK